MLGLDKRPYRTILLLVLVSLCANIDSPADPDKFLEERKKDIDFREWPGKQLPLKPGFAFDPQDYPALTGWQVTRDTLDYEFTNTGIVRNLMLTKESMRFRVSIGVVSGTPENAQELLIRQFLVINAPMVSFVRADSIGSDLGDVALVSAVSSKEDLGSIIRFVRRNILIILEDRATTGPQVDFSVTALAKAIDQKVVALADVTEAEFSALAPSFTKMLLSASSLKRGEGPDSRATLTVETSDPRDETVKKFVGPTGSLGVEREEGIFHIRTGEDTGTLSFTVFAVNKSLLRTEKVVSITVE